MNRYLKKSIRDAFDTPAPLRKKEFLRKLPPPSISMSSFLWGQISYIRKWVWAVCFCVFVAAFMWARSAAWDAVWLLSALTPLLALTIVVESRRSDICGMAELELSSRFSLKSVTLARLTILGMANFILLCLLLLLPFYQTDRFLQAGVYLLCPYLFTAFTGLWVSRKIRTKESVYSCMGIAVMVSFVCLNLHSVRPTLYEPAAFLWWVCAFFLSGAAFLREGHILIQQTEELAWL